MTFRYGVSIAALMVAAFGPGAQAQTVNTTPSDVNVLNLLAPYLGLNATATGQQTLQLNLSQSAGINAGAGLSQQQLAISDKNLLGSASNDLSALGLGVYGVAANLAGGLPAQMLINGIVPQQLVGGLGAQLGPIYQRGVAQGANGPLGSVVNLLVGAYTFTGNNLGVAKNYFANGAASNPSVTPANYVATAAVAPAGYSLPTFNGLPNTTNSVYDLAYGVTNTQSGQDVYGSSRPVQAAPARFNIFDPTALNGIATNPSFPSGHTTYAYTDGILLAMLVPQQYQSMLARAADYANSRIALGVHYPLDIIGGRALATYDLAQAFTNPAYINNAAVTGHGPQPARPVRPGARPDPGLSRRPVRQHRRGLRGPFRQQRRQPLRAVRRQPSHLSAAAHLRPAHPDLRPGAPRSRPRRRPERVHPARAPLRWVHHGRPHAGPNGGLYGQLSTATINQIVVNTETNALAAFYGTSLSYWSRVDLYSAAGYFSAVTGTLRMDATDRLGIDVGIGQGGALYANGTITGTAFVGARRSTRRLGHAGRDQRPVGRHRRAGQLDRHARPSPATSPSPPVRPTRSRPTPQGRPTGSRPAAAPRSAAAPSRSSLRRAPTTRAPPTRS